MGRSHSHRHRKMANKATGPAQWNTQRMAERLLDRGLITVMQAFGPVDWSTLGPRQRERLKRHIQGGSQHGR